MSYSTHLRSDWERKRKSKNLIIWVSFWGFILSAFERLFWLWYSDWPYVSLQNGCWELMWKEHESHTLLHAFHSMAITHIHACNVKPFWSFNKMKLPYHSIKIWEKLLWEREMCTFVLNLKLIKRDDVTIVTSGEANFRMWNITMDKEGYHMIIRRTRHQEYTIILILGFKLRDWQVFVLSTEKPW